MSRVSGKTISHIIHVKHWGFDVIVFTDGSGLRPHGDERGVDLVYMSAECVALAQSLNDVADSEWFKRSSELQGQIFSSDECVNEVAEEVAA